MKKPILYTIAAVSVAAITAIIVAGCNSGEDVESEGLNKFLGSFISGGSDSTPNQPQMYSLKVSASPSDGGRVDVDPRQDSYSFGTSVTVKAVPENGFKFINWSGDAEGDENPLKITMDEKKVVVAIFAREGQNLITIDFENEAGDNPKSISGVEGYEIPLPTPPSSTPCVEFAGWSSAKENQNVDYKPGETYKFGSADVTLYAVWNVATYELKTKTTGDGYIAISELDIKDKYNCGDTVWLTAIANGGSVFTGWTGAGLEGKGETVMVIMDGNKEVTANFKSNGGTPVTPKGEYLLDDFNNGVNTLGFAGAVYTWGNLDIKYITSVKNTNEFVYGPTGTGEYNGWNGPLVPMKCGRSGADYDNCAGIEYANVRSQSGLAPYPGLGICTQFTLDATTENSALKNAQKISFWAKGTPGVTVNLLLQDNADGQSPYAVYFEVTNDWKQYEYSIVPVDSYKAGDFKLVEWASEYHDFKAEKTTSINWNIDVSSMDKSGTGYLYIDDILLYYPH